jgi:hypothetical protein
MGFLFFAARIDLVAVKALDRAEIVMALFDGRSPNAPVSDDQPITEGASVAMPNWAEPDFPAVNFRPATVNTVPGAP